MSKHLETDQSSLVKLLTKVFRATEARAYRVVYHSRRQIAQGDWIEMEECEGGTSEAFVLFPLLSRMMIVIFTKICSEHIVKIFDQYT
jgi:hypothetical protein